MSLHLVLIGIKEKFAKAVIEDQSGEEFGDLCGNRQNILRVIAGGFGTSTCKCRKQWVLSKWGVFSFFKEVDPEQVLWLFHLCTKYQYYSTVESIENVILLKGGWQSRNFHDEVSLLLYHYKPVPGCISRIIYNYNLKVNGILPVFPYSASKF